MVWIEEINKYFLHTLRNGLTFRNEMGNITPVTVDYSQPEGEGRADIDEQLPKVTVHLYDLLLDLSRVGVNQGGKLVVDENDFTVTVKESPDPYWLFYQFSILSEYQEDSISILTQIQSLFPPRTTIWVDDSESGEKVALYMEMVDYDRPRRQFPEKTHAEERLSRRFRSLFRYKVTAELPKTLVENYYKVLKTELEIQEEGG